MKKLLTTTALVLTLAFSGNAMAHSDWYGGDAKKDGAPSYIEEALVKMPKAKADAFRATMSRAHEENVQNYADQAHKLHAELQALLSAETFDKDAFLSKRQELEDIHGKMRTHMDEAFATAAQDLTQHERQLLITEFHKDKVHAHHHKATKPKNTESPSQTEHNN